MPCLCNAWIQFGVTFMPYDFQPLLILLWPAADTFEDFPVAGLAAEPAAKLVCELAVGFTESFTFLIRVSVPVAGFFQYFIPSLQRRFTQKSFSGLSSSSFNLNSFQPQLSHVWSSRVNFPVLGTEWVYPQRFVQPRNRVSLKVIRNMPPSHSGQGPTVSGG